MRYIIIFLLFSSFVHAQNVIIGRDAIPDNQELITDAFLFFDESNGAMRGGLLSNSANWSPDSIGGTSFAFGFNTLASGFGSFAIGNESKARGFYSFASGSQGIASGDNSFAGGFQTKASGVNSFAVGSGNIASGFNAFSSGLDNQAEGNHSFASGDFTLASGNASFSAGLATRARSSGEFAIGSWNTDYTPQSANSWNANDRIFVIGNGADSGNKSDAMLVKKNGDVMFPDGSFLVGRDSMPKNEEVVSEQLMFFEKNKNAFRGGRLFNSANWAPDSIGLGSFGFGYNVLASDTYSTAFGESTQASGYVSFASGRNSKASGFYTFASGFSTIASGERSFASGYFSQASGDNAFASGYLSRANGDNSFVAGIGTRAESYSEFSIGSFNTEYVANDQDFWDENDRLFVIGNGPSISTRSDAMVVLKNGNTNINGDVKISDGSDPELVFERSNVGAWDAKIRVGNTGHMYFEGGTDIANGLATNMVLRSNGRLGIRNTNPDKELHVQGQVKIQAFNNNTDANLYMQPGAGTEGRILTVQPNGHFLLGDIDNVGDNLYIKAGGDERISILNDGKTGVGTSNPKAQFHVKEDGIVNEQTVVQILESGTSKRPVLLFSENENNDFGSGMSIEYNGSGVGPDNMLSINSFGGTAIVSFKNDGKVGIGTAIPSVELHVEGSICYSGSIAACSDLRYKTNFSPINNALSKVNQLNGLYYDWKISSFPEKEFSDQRQIGVIAQEVEPLFPEMVFTDNEGYKSVDYSRLTPVLIEAVKELTDQNEELLSRMDKMEKQLALLLEANN